MSLRKVRQAARRWLWLISVGVTDVQFPVWVKDEYGCWQGPQRFDLARSEVRKTHEGLLNLLRRERICYAADLSPAVERRIADTIKFEFEHDSTSDEFLAALHPPEYRLSQYSDCIPNDQEDQLPLYFPKVTPLIPAVRTLFADHPVSVLVLNTCRAQDFRQASQEPIASGPLVAHYLAQQCDLKWQDNAGQVPATFASGSATWLDLLVAHEALEDPAAQARVVERLNAALRAWMAGSTAKHSVLMTTSGGMPPLKPLIERVCAIHVGQSQVTLLDQPEHRSRDGATTPMTLNYGERIAERETLRFHCIEALRSGDYAGAYGLARRAGQEGWANLVCHRLGPLLELPGQPLHLKGSTVEPFVLHACQVETRLCMGDIAGALLRLGPFIESVVWKLIAQDARIRSLNLQVDRANESLMGSISWDHPLFSTQVQYFRPNPEGTNQHRINGLTWEWPKWLAEPEGEQREVALALIQVCMFYNSDQYGISPRQYRNLLAHGAELPTDLPEITQCLKNRKLISAVGRPFGDNFMNSERVSTLLHELGQGNLKDSLCAYLADIQQRIIEG